MRARPWMRMSGKASLGPHPFLSATYCSLIIKNKEQEATRK